MTRRTTLAFFIFLLPLLSQAQVKAYPIDAWHSSISFHTKFGGLLPVKGSLDRFWGTVLLDESDLTRTSATITIDTKSISTGVGMRDKHLKSEDFFEAEKYPQMTFTSSRVVRNDDGFIMKGVLDLHGITKEVEIAFSLVHGEQPDPWKNFRVTLQGTVEINRLDFGIGEGQVGISDKVSIDLIISARVFNTETIGLFNRPFGQKMVMAFEEGGIVKAREVLGQLKSADDKDAIKPASFEFLYLKLKQGGKMELSKQAATLFAEVFPENAEALSQLGYSYYENNQHKEAVSAFQKALTFDQQESLALEMLKHLNN